MGFSSAQANEGQGALAMSTETALELVNTYCVNKSVISNLANIAAQKEDVDKKTSKKDIESRKINRVKSSKLNKQNIYISTVLKDGKLINEDGSANWVVFDRNQKLSGHFESKDAISSVDGKFNWEVICGEVESKDSEFTKKVLMTYMGLSYRDDLKKIKLIKHINVEAIPSCKTTYCE